MKILIACHVRWFNAEAFYALNVAELFQQRGHQVLVSTHPDSPLVSRATQAGVASVQEVDLLSKSPVVLSRGLARYLAVLRSFKPDLITVHRSQSLFFTILALKLARSSACVLRFRGEPIPPRSSIGNRWLYGRACQAIVVSGQTLKKSFLASLPLEESKISVIYAPVDELRFRPRRAGEKVRQAWGLNPDALIVGVVGRIGKVKGHFYLLETIGLLPEKFKEVHFFIAYHEEHAGVTALKQEVTARGLKDRISFFGYTPHIEELIRAADMGLISSIGSEANCRVALEFMATGLPLVATRIGVIPEIVQDGQTGFIVPPREPSQAAARLSELLENETLRTKMGHLARQRVEKHFSQDIFFDNIWRLYQNVCRNEVTSGY